MQISHPMRCCLFLSFFLPMTSATSSATEISLRTVAISGQTVPGRPDLTLGFSLGDANLNPARVFDLNRQGQVAFTAELSSGAQAVFTEAGGQGLRIVAETNTTPADGDPSDPIRFISGVLINDRGDTVFSASGLAGSGIWHNQIADGNRLVARSADALEPPRGRTFEDSRVSAAFLNEQGQIAFDVETRTGTVSAWWERPGGLEILIPTDKGFVSTSVAALGNNGAVLIGALHEGSTCEPRDDDRDPHTGVWLRAPEGLWPVARTDTSPQFGTCQVAPLGIGSEGQVLFSAWNRSDPTYFAWQADGTTTSLLTTDFTERNLNPPAVVSHVLSADLSDNGTFSAVVSVARKLSLVSTIQGRGLETLLASGQPIPGTDLTTNDPLGSIEFIMDRQDQMLIQATTKRGNDVFESYLLRRPSGEFVELVSVGDSLSVAPNDTRVVAQLSSLSYGTTSDGGPTRFNDAGQFAFTAQFTDRSVGLFVLTVPEPTSPSWGLAFTVAWMRRKR